MQTNLFGRISSYIGMWNTVISIYTMTQTEDSNT